MFTGIVQQMGLVESLSEVSCGRRLIINPGQWSFSPRAGDSVAVNGCCLTAVQADPSHAPPPHLHFEVVSQTLSATNLGDLRAGDPVNLESPTTPSTLMSGHLVQGHIDGVGTIVAADAQAIERRLRIAPPRELLEYIVDKGSIAVDGVSLTIALRGDDWFEVALIPTTLALSNLDRAGVGDRVNIEADYVAKVVVSWLKRSQGE